MGEVRRIRGNLKDSLTIDIINRRVIQCSGQCLCCFLALQAPFTLQGEKGSPRDRGSPDHRVALADHIEGVIPHGVLG
ncbi:MAG: hypothetical protein BWY93_00951 [Euryarchaeota archaeon ADurb.BinA087]|nr:MAG: hypothetical protein BWY93_00951 [Euryarchaeota archaeon ADurb.BinA087]